MQNRINGYDVARACAIFGMVFVNFKLAMGAHEENGFWQFFYGLLQGRASATFVVLAGIGLSLMSRKALRINGPEIGQTRLKILKRGVLLFVIGLLYTPIWPADILHFYGVYFVFAALVFHLSCRFLWFLIVVVNLIFLSLLLTLDYSAGWNFETLTYADFWTPSGMLRHLFFNGFHPVFPWVAFVFFGLWLGRQRLDLPEVRSRFLWISTLGYLLVEAGMFALRYGLLNQGGLAGTELEDILGTGPMPPMPQYIVAGMCAATILICTCVACGQRWPQHLVVRSLVATGQHALTHYVAHVLIGMGLLESLGLLEGQPVWISATAAFLYCLCAIGFSVLWQRRSAVGPLERLFRALS